MKRLLWCFLLGLVVLELGCGGGTSGPAGPGGVGGGGNTFSATVGSQPWASDANRITVTGNSPPGRQGTIAITGYQVSSGIGLSLSLSFIVGPATQPLGVNPGTTPGGVGTVIVSTDSWTTPLSGQAGFVTITERSGDRIAGSFHFTADPILPGPPAKVVTGGAFDITIPTGLPPLPTGFGSTAVATIGGTPWNGATIVGLYGGPGIFSISAANTAYSFTLVPKVPVVAGNTYGIPSQMGLTVLGPGTADSWTAITGPDIGSVFINTFDNNRLWATSLNATLPSLSAGLLTVTNGAVNVHLE